MNELIMQENETINKTPIEIALGIDEEGRTTAKKLYEFLELDSKNYSRWCKTNIIENQFAEENVDFEVLVAKEENPLGGRPTQDFKLTADFAKKLSMTAKNKKGEESKDYFVKVENGTKKLVRKISGLSSELQFMIRLELNQKEQATELKHIDSRVDHLEDTMTIDYGQQLELRDLAKSTVLHVIGGKHSLAYTYQYPKKSENDKPPKLFGIVMSRIWHDYQDYFGVNSYKNTPVVRFDEAKVYLSNWKPPINMRLEIEKINRGQMQYEQ